MKSFNEVQECVFYCKLHLLNNFNETVSCAFSVLRKLVLKKTCTFLSVLFSEDILHEERNVLSYSMTDVLAKFTSV